MKTDKWVQPKIGRGHNISDIIQIGNIMYIINSYYYNCEDECDLYNTCACSKVACKREERLDRMSVSFKEIL